MNVQNMYDSITVAALPLGANVYAAYVNGDYANYQQVRLRFPKARIFGIDVIGGDWRAASILDYEKGNQCYSPDVLKTFAIERENFMPHTTCIYCDRSDLPDVEAALNGIWHVLWITTLDGTILTGERTAEGNLIVATQYQGGATAAYDVSSVMTDWIK